MDPRLQYLIDGLSVSKRPEVSALNQLSGLSSLEQERVLRSFIPQVEKGNIKNPSGFFIYHMRRCANIVRPKLCAEAERVFASLQNYIDATALAKLAALSDEDQVRVLNSFRANFKHGNASAYLTTIIQAANKPKSLPRVVIDTDEEWFLKSLNFSNIDTKTKNKLKQITQASKDLISKDEVYTIWELVALKEKTSIEKFLREVATIVQDLHKRRQAQIDEYHSVKANTPTPRFKLSASKLGMSFIFRCPRLLHRLTKNAKYVDPRAWETRGLYKQLDDAFDASRLSLRAALLRKGFDHERWINSLIESEVQINGISYDLINIEDVCRQEHPQSDKQIFDKLVNQTSLHLLKTAPIGTVLYQAALLPTAQTYQALGLETAWQRGDIELSRSLLDYVFITNKNNKRTLIVVDAKASKHVKLAHQVQVTLYSMLLEIALDGDITCEVGGVWLPSENAPQFFELEGLKRRVSKFLLTEVAAKLNAQAFNRDFDDDDEWRLQTSCLSCDFLPTCRQQAMQQGRLDILPYLSQNDEVQLRNFYLTNQTQNSYNENECVSLRKAIEAIVGQSDGKKSFDLPTGTRKALSRIHLAYDEDVKKWESQKRGTALDAIQTNSVTLTGLPCASLPYLSKTESGVLVITLDLDPHIAEPYSYGIEFRPRPNSRPPIRKQFVVAAEDFTSENTKIATALSQRVRNAVLRLQHQLIDDLFEILHPLEGQRICVCVFEESDKTALTDILFRIALDPLGIDAARANKALGILATLGTESKQLPLNKHAKVYGLETSTSDESHLFLPRLTVLHSAIRRLVVLPVAGLYTFEDILVHLSEHDTCQARAEIAASCWRESTFRIWSLRHKLFSAVETRQLRVGQLLERRIECIFDIFYHLRKRIGIEAATNDHIEPISTMDIMECDDADNNKKYYRALPLKAAKISVENVCGPISHPIVSRLFFFSQLECSTAIFQQRETRSQPIEVITQGQKAAIVRVFAIEDDTKRKGKSIVTLTLENGRADAIEIDKIENDAWILAPVATRGVVLRYADARDMESFGPRPKLPMAFGSIRTRINSTTNRFLFRTHCESQQLLNSSNSFILFPRVTDVTTSKILSQLIEEDATPKTSLFIRILDDACNWCQQEPHDANVLKAAPSSRRGFVPTTNSQYENYTRVLERRGVIVEGPPGAGKTHWSAACILRYVLAHLRKKSSCTRVLVTAFTHAALDGLLKKIAILFEEYLRKNNSVLILKADTCRPPSAVGEPCSYRVESRKWIDAHVVALHPESNEVSIRMVDDNNYQVIRVESNTSVVRQRFLYNILPNVDTVVNKIEQNKHEVVILGATVYKTRTIMSKLTRKFDLLLVDEASQMLLSHASLALSALNPEHGRLVVVGDTRQMPPTIRTQLPDEIMDKTEVAMSFLAFLRKKLEIDAPECIGELQENHRMCSTLCAFTTAALDYSRYHMCRPEVGCSCRQNRATDFCLEALPATSNLFWTNEILAPTQPLIIVVLVNDEGQSPPTLEETIRAEAAVCADLLTAYENARQLCATDKPMAGAFVVTPHHVQRRAVREHVSSSNIECDTVEKMQGREHDLTIACFAGLDVAGLNDSAELDFVFDSGRLVVSLSRSKKKLILLTTNSLFDPSMHVFNSDRRRQAERLLQRVYSYTAEHGRIFELRCPSRAIRSINAISSPHMQPLPHLPNINAVVDDGSETDVSSSDSSVSNPSNVASNGNPVVDSVDDWIQSDEDDEVFVDDTYNHIPQTPPPSRRRPWFSRSPSFDSL